MPLPRACGQPVETAETAQAALGPCLARVDSPPSRQTPHCRLDTLPPPVAFGDVRWRTTPLPVSGDPHVQGARVGLHGLLACAVTGMASRTPVADVRGRAQRGRPRGVECALHHPLGELLQSSVFPEHIVWGGRVCASCVSQGCLLGVHTGHLALLWL